MTPFVICKGPVTRLGSTTSEPTAPREVALGYVDEPRVFADQRSVSTHYTD